ncbi:MAG: hypothetical protein HYT80_08365 [Euryarchaeota archaeon]|nr:hypothetical protein [Euryarchaeota archaeon]
MISVRDGLIARLRRLHAEGLPDTRIAERLGVSVFCGVCSRRCFRLLIQSAHQKGIDKSLRGTPRRKDPTSPFGARVGRVERRYETLDFVYCRHCGENRNMQGNPIWPKKVKAAGRETA